MPGRIHRSDFRIITAQRPVQAGAQKANSYLGLRCLPQAMTSRAACERRQIQHRFLGKPVRPASALNQQSNIRF
jgi:hypothetical protein